MDPDIPSVDRIIATLGYAVLGAIVTAVVGLAVLNLAEPVQALVYDAFYRRAGPSGATEVAILIHFLVGSLVALAVAMLVGELLSDRGENLGALGAGFGAMVALFVAFLVVILAGFAGFLSTLLVLAVLALGIPLLLRYRVGLRSGAIPAFVGGVPVVVGLLFLAGFGLAWGWGFVMTAETVPASSVDGPVADFDEVPAVRDDLLVGDCRTIDGDRRRCALQLRGYEHEVAAAEFMDRRGVRCRYPNTHSGEEAAFVAEHDGTYYRVTCSAHGD